MPYRRMSCKGWARHSIRANPDPSTISTCDANTAVGWNNQRKLVRASDGTLYVTYFKLVSGAQQIFVAKSIDNGTTWIDETRISTYPGMSSTWQQTPAIVIDSNDNLYVVWQGAATGYSNNQIWYAKYNGTAWSTPERISTASGMESYTQSNPSIAVDLNNYIHVVWKGGATGYSVSQIWYATYNSSWQTPVRISTASGMESYAQKDPSIAVDINNFVYVIWFGQATDYTGYDKIWYANYTTSWSTPICLQAIGQNTYPNLRWSFYPASNRFVTRLDYVFTEGTASPYSIKFSSVFINYASFRLRLSGAWMHHTTAPT